MALDDLKLPFRVKRILGDVGIHDLDALAECRLVELLSLRGFGRGSAKAVEAALAANGRQLRPWDGRPRRHPFATHYRDTAPKH